MLKEDVRFEQSPELVEAIDRESFEVPCENKIGFIALCASCPLVSLFGECPKDVINKPQQLEFNEIESINGDSFQDIGFNFESMVPQDPNGIEVVPVRIVEPPQPKENPVTVEKTPKPKQKSEQKVDKKKIEKVIEKKAAPSYLELLLDDAVPVVVATAFRPVKKEVQLPPNEPTHNQELNAETPVMKELEPVQVKEPESILTDPEPEFDSEAPLPAVELKVIPAQEPIEPVIFEESAASIEDDIDVPFVESLDTTTEYPPQPKPLEKKNNSDVQSVPDLGVIYAIAPQEEVKNKPEFPEAVLVSSPASAIDKELVSTVETIPLEENYHQPEPLNEQPQQPLVTEKVAAPEDTPEILAQNTMFDTSAILKNIWTLLGSFVLKITL